MYDWPEELDISDRAKDFVDKLLSLDPKQRLGADGIQSIKVTTTSPPYLPMIQTAEVLGLRPSPLAFLAIHMPGPFLLLFSINF